jgi:hypothetical protein
MVCSYEEIIGPSCLLHRGKSTKDSKLHIKVLEAV